LKGKDLRAFSFGEDKRVRRIGKMKKGIHPSYKMTTIECVCGNSIETRSTRDGQKLEICSNCHPFFTGQQKFVDTAGRVEKFYARYGEDQAAT
jgi:large subunit ribosomal protein L31